MSEADWEMIKARLDAIEARVAKLEAVNQAELEQHAAEQQQDFQFGQGEDSEAR